MDITTAFVVVTLPASPDRRLNAPSSASMNSSAFFNASCEIACGSAPAASLASSAPLPPVVETPRRPRGGAHLPPARPRPLRPPYLAVPGAKLAWQMARQY